MSEANAPAPRRMADYEKEVHLSDYLNVLLRRWKISAIVFALVFLGIALYTFLSTPIFEATPTLEVRKAKKNDMMQKLGLEDDNALTTEIEVLQSRSLAEQVVRRLNLDWQFVEMSKGLDIDIAQFAVSSPLPEIAIELTGPRAFKVSEMSGRVIGQGESGKPFSAGGIELQLEVRSGDAGQRIIFARQESDDLVKGILGNLKVAEMGKGSNILRISSQNPDPERARDILSALLDAYREMNVELNSREAGRTVDFIAQQLAGLKGALDSAEQELQEYKLQTGLITLGPEGGSLVQKMVGVEQQRADLRLKRERVEYAINALQQALKSGSHFTPPVIEGIPALAESATRLANLEAERKSMLVNFTPAHPAVLEKDQEVRRVMEAMLTTYQSVRQELALGERDLARTIAGYDEQLKDIPETELELAKRTRVHKVNSELYNFLLQKQQEAKIAQAATLSNVEVIDLPATPRKPVKPNKPKNLALGLVLGLMLGVGLAFLLDYLDQTIKTSEDVREKLGLSVYGVIPRIPFADEEENLPRRRLVTTLAPRSPVVEAFRALRTNINYAMIKENHKVILVTSCLPSEGKSTISGNLAVILAQAGSKVLLVGCDLRRPSLYDVFGVSAEPGLTDLLIHEKQGVVRHFNNPKFDLITAGAIPPNPVEILDSERMRSFVAKAREHYDYVILDAPPVLPVTDAQILAPLADVNLVVLEPCRVPEKAALQMIEAFNSVDAKISGVILNDKSGRGFKYYGSYNYYGNKYYRGYYGESSSETADRPAVAAIKRVWEKLNS